MKSYFELIRHSGNQNLFRAVEMSVAALQSGYPFHIHVEGLRGTGKTTIMRAAKEILPPIVRIAGCLYNCHPANPHCPEHKTLTPAQIAAIGTETVPCPFLEISHAAKLGTVVGSIDLGKLTNPLEPIAAMLPGTIPQANRGIIFIDEINRLADTAPELADVLLDVMGTKPGKIQIEETGLPTVTMPVNVTVWAASNPDEDPGGLTQIRRQLSDRFDAVIAMGRPNEYQAVTCILDQRRTGGKQALSTPVAWQLPLYLDAIQSDERIMTLLASIYIDFGLESLRGIEALATGARLNALLEGRNSVTSADLISVIPLTLGHRTDSGTITNILRYLETSDAATAEKNDAYAQKETSRLNFNHEQGFAPATQEKAWWMRCWARLSALLSRRNKENSGYNHNHTANAASAQNGTAAHRRVDQVPVNPLEACINAPAG
ncbi:MAG: magnesium chelatase, partial [Negativicutes bacterium]|nr:magnesium chelatase [Negativicutes bacterium]